MKKVLAALCMIVLFCIVFLSISGCTEEEKTEEANQSNYGKQQCFEHNFGTYLVEIAPTCTEKGIESAYCAVCGEKSVREIQPLGHDLEGLPCEGRDCTRCEYTEAPTAHVYELIEEIPADCLYAGIKIYSCECGESYTEEVPASGHSFGEWQVSTPSTCIKEGVEKRVCERCGEEEVRSIPEAEHVFSEWTVTKEPDCTEAGSQERICSVCHKTETAEIPAVGHKYGLVEECPATCAKNGKKIFECSVCHDIKEEITEDKLNHDFGGAAACAEGVTCIRCGKERLPLPHSHATREIEPTCTESGYSEEYCTECGKIFAKIENAEPSGHDFCEWRLVKAPTCTEPGTEERVCRNCGHAETRIAEAAGHDFGEALPCEEGVVCVKCGAAMPTVPHTCATRGKEATCTESGYKETYCTVCGKVIGERTESAALGHDYGEWETDIAATCVAEGVEKRVCIRCEISETRAIPVTEHEWEEVFVLPATETSEGKTTYKCSICHAVKEETIPKIEHVHDYDYVSIYGVGVACSCGRVNANEGNVMMDANGIVDGINEGSGNIIVVPNSAYDVDWRTVFYMNDEIEYIYFGENITLIADPCAFEGCENLKAIYVSTECYIPVVPDFWPDMEIIRVDYNS